MGNITLPVGSVLIWVAVLNMPDGKLHVTVLDVGQGDAILVHTPSQQNILIDGGPSPQAIGLELGKKLPFWNRTIDLVISTQPQADHITGLMDVLQDYNVKHVVEPATRNDSVTYREWLDTVAAKQLDHEIAGAGQQIEFGDGVRMELLHPPYPLLQGTSDDINNNCLVLRLCWNKVSFLLTADIAREAEWYLTAQRANLKSTVLKVAHHGSATSTSPEFLAVVDPEVAVISASADNRFGLPDREVVDRLAAKIGNERVFLTSKDGAVEFTTDGQRLWVKHDR